MKYNIPDNKLIWESIFDRQPRSKNKKPREVSDNKLPPDQHISFEEPREVRDNKLPIPSDPTSIVLTFFEDPVHFKLGRNEDVIFLIKAVLFDSEAPWYVRLDTSIVPGYIITVDFPDDEHKAEGIDLIEKLAEMSYTKMTYYEALRAHWSNLGRDMKDFDEPNVDIRGRGGITDEHLDPLNQKVNNPLINLKRDDNPLYTDPEDEI